MRISEFFQDECGSLSMSRLLMFFIVSSYITWVSFGVIHSETIVTAIPDLPTGLLWLIGMLYGINKIGPNIGVNVGSGQTTSKG